MFHETTVSLASLATCDNSYNMNSWLLSKYWNPSNLHKSMINGDTKESRKFKKSYSQDTGNYFVSPRPSILSALQMIKRITAPLHMFSSSALIGREEDNVKMCFGSSRSIWRTVFIWCVLRAHPLNCGLMSCFCFHPFSEQCNIISER